MFVLLDTEKAKLDKLSSWDELESKRITFSNEMTEANNRNDKSLFKTYWELNHYCKKLQNDFDDVDKINAKAKYKEVLNKLTQAINSKDRIEQRRLHRIKNEMLLLIEDHKYHELLKIKV